MGDWDVEEEKYLENPGKFIEDLAKELDEERVLQEQRRAGMKNKIKWEKPRIGIRRNYSQRGQRGFHQSFPPKEVKRVYAEQIVTDVKLRIRKKKSA